MLSKVPVERLDDYFSDLRNRKQKGVYFYRINGYNQAIHDFLIRYHEAARLGGIIIEGRLNNPDNRMLDYYSEMMGMDFVFDKTFIQRSMHKWLPRMNDVQCSNVSDAVFDVLNELKQNGKNDNVLKNVYIKFMCWFYYKFERILHQLSNDKLPKILYEGSVSNYELLILNVLCIAGCDIVLLQYNGDEEYAKADPSMTVSANLNIEGMTAFPQNFSLKLIREEIMEKLDRERLYGELPQRLPCTNAWMSGKILEDIRMTEARRGNDSRFFCNCFCRMSGTEDRVTYLNELHNLYNDLISAKRNVVIVNGTIPPPTPEGISRIKRKDYQRPDQLILDLSGYLRALGNDELQRIANKAYVDILMEEAKIEGMTIPRLTKRAVYLLCWLNRYKGKLFNEWKYPKAGVFIHMGGCKNEAEVLFCRFLSRLPVDVVIFAPDLNESCCIPADELYEVRYQESLVVEQFPESQQGLRVGTAAFHAERDLDRLMYQDSGIYRNQQYDKAETITLQTTYEEIAILWEQELKYRPNFNTGNGVASVPVIYSKVSGVKNADISAYWQSVKNLITPDALVYINSSMVDASAHNPVKQFAAGFFRNGKLQRKEIKEHKSYQYSIFKESIEEYILDKIQLLIDSKIIKGTFENGTEYNIIATLLNLDKNLIRLIQKFDFTKANPKLIYIITTEYMLKAEDVILISFLNMIGFDIIFFVPTGYECFEKHLNRRCFDEHQIGEYMYDLSPPNIKNSSGTKRQSWRDKIFKRGS